MKVAVIKLQASFTGQLKVTISTSVTGQLNQDPLNSQTSENTIKRPQDQKRTLMNWMGYRF